MDLTWITRNLLEPALRLVLVFLLVALGLRFFHALAGRVFFTGKGRIDERRAKTLTALLKSVINYFFYFVGAAMVLQILGVSVAPLIATAGLASLAIGFGAQNLVRDVITGFFLLLEDQYAVGDYIKVAAAAGVVEEIGLRTTKIRGFGGELYIIPNGQIQTVTNYMGPKMRVMLDVGFAYETDVNQVYSLLEPMFTQLQAECPALAEGPTVLGVQNLGKGSVGIRIRAWAKPMQQWDLERELRQRLKTTFDAHGLTVVSCDLVEGAC